MEGLREQELRTLVGFAHDAARIARFEPRRLERWLVERVGELIRPTPSTSRSADGHVRRNLFLPRRRRAAIRSVPQQLRRPSRVGEVTDQHPLVIERLRHPTETRALRLSDFVTLRQLHALEVYDTVLRPFDLNHCVTARFFGSSRFTISCARDSIDLHTGISCYSTS